MNESLKRKVYQRDLQACWHCGVTEGLSIQHRMNRQMGGSKQRDRLDNLIAFCIEGNQRMESDANFAILAKDNGWKLSTWEPFSTPVFSAWQVKWFVLDEFGNKEEVGAPDFLI